MKAKTFLIFSELLAAAPTARCAVSRLERFGIKSLAQQALMGISLAFSRRRVDSAWRFSDSGTGRFFDRMRLD